jgi:polyisoprenoid-binding protein YceI
MLRSTVLMSVLLTAGSAVAAPTVYKFNDPQNRDNVTFMIDAPLETIIGLTNHLTGQITVDGKKASGELKVPVNTLRTGNSTRDEHLQNEKWLDAKKFPEIVMSFKDLELPAPLEPGKPIKLNTKAKFTIHGITREEPVEVTATLHKESEMTQNRLKGDLLQLKAKFNIPIDEYKIESRRAIVLKVGDTAEVKVSAYGSNKL